jgi:hypothetical protein
MAAAIRSVFGTIIGGFYLIVLYVFTVWLVVGSLTAIQIRDDAQEVNAEITFADVERSYIRHGNRISEIYSDVDRILYEYNQHLDAINWQIDETLDTIRQSTNGDAAMSPYDFEGSSEFADVREGCDARRNSADAICQLVVSYYDLLAARQQHESNLDNSQIAQLYAEADKQVSELRAAEPLARFFDIYEFFNFMPLYDVFLKEPQQILVLQLTIVMGMLGSVITMTWSFIKRDSGFTFRRFLILPFVGAMSAFIIFVFIKAGQLTLTAGNASEPLNPFVLSFVGIISGLLSERAYSRMAEVGGNFFKVDEDKPRYGIELRTALELSGLGEHELAGYLKLSEEETAAIVDGRAAASPLQQQLVAAGLRRSIREIFTDLPPDSAAPPPAAPPPAARPADPPVAEQPA